MQTSASRMDAIDLGRVDAVVARLGRDRGQVIPILQALQAEWKYLPEAALRRVCEITDVTPAQIAGVSTFYAQFRHRPVGKHVISVCHGTACHVKGAPLVSEAFRRFLKIPQGEDTDPDGLFTLQRIACLGCCTLAPVVQIDDAVYGYLTPERVPRVIHDFQRREKQPARRFEAARTGDVNAGEVRIGLGSCCISKGSLALYEAVDEALREVGSTAMVKRVGCVGMCYHTPILEVVPPGGEPVLYTRVRPDQARKIVRQHFKPCGFVRRVDLALREVADRLFTESAWEPIGRFAVDQRDPVVSAFLGRQRHIATDHCGVIDPLDLEEYRARDQGFAALARCLRERSPAEVVAEIERSGLRGRGGAGFPTGRKWALVQAAKARPKYILCNGDEGDPGAFMDRMILESYPYRVLEGMAIAAYAVGAEEGFLYVRAEYPLALERLREALRRMTEAGLLGERILGSGVRLTLAIKEGAGAFVCGEESAMLQALAGNRGMPRIRPPFPAEAGYRGQPTLINNVETYALVPWILRQGAPAFAALGTAASKGTKVFALAGKVARGGLIEVPMGVTIREIVEEIGGGIANGREFKAVLIGGPSGGCVPARLADTPIDFDELAHAGAMMGSGGLVVLDETDCVVDIARYFLEFTQSESCGKCTCCRVGTRRMLEMLERFCAGEAQSGDIEKLEDLARVVKRSSLCGLGKTAPNPVLTTLRFFREEYEAHVAGRCPAGRCRALVTYTITEDCIGCTLCAQNCPVEAIAVRPYAQHEIDTTKCVRCGMCRQICPEKAIRVE